MSVTDGMDVDVVSSRIFFISARFFLLTLLAYFSAQAVNTLAAMWLAPPPALHAAEASPLPPAQPQRPLSAYAIVHTRDIFHSVKASIQTDGNRVAARSGALLLRGTAVGDQERAFAILEDHTTHVQKLYREGDAISPEITLMQVDWDRVVIARQGRRETLVLSTQTASASRQSAVVATSGSRQAGVRQVAQDTFQIDRREVEHVMNNLNDLFTQVRAVPYTSEEGPQGFRLFAIKVGSFIDRLGVKNGDIVQRVNGVEIADPGTAFSLLEDLQGLSRVQIDVLRNHQPITLSYEIH